MGSPGGIREPGLSRAFGVLATRDRTRFCISVRMTARSSGDRGQVRDPVHAAQNGLAGNHEAGGLMEGHPVQPDDAMFTAVEVARLFNVHPRTVTRWVRDGKLSSVRTPAGHRRFLRSEVLALADGSADGAASHGAAPHGAASHTAEDVCVVCSAPAVRDGAGRIFQWVTVACSTSDSHEHRTPAADPSW